MNNKRKSLSLFLVAAIVMTMFQFGSTTAFAASDPDSNRFDLADGGITLSAGTASGIKVSYGSSSKDNIAFSENIEIFCSDDTKTNTITVEGGLSDNVNITLSGVNIDAPGTSGSCAFSIGSGSTVNLTLTGTNTLKSGSGCAGLAVPEGASLTIKEDSGSLTAIGGSGGAGIGGGRGTDGSGGSSGGNGVAGGTITIEGGTVTATGNGGAGIGGGTGGYGTSSSSDKSGGTGGSGGTITINGGKVTATGNSRGAGIGGGAGGNGKENLNDYDGYCVNGGRGGSGGTIKINGGTVTSSGDGAGIGGGCGGAASNGTDSKGNGGGGGDSGTITITGGSVTAAGGSGSTGIGGGHGGGSTSTNVPYSYGGSGGSGGSGELITISGGVVIASGSAAGIGGGSGNSGSYSYYYIGGYGGSGGNGGTVAITGGAVTASGSTADIGGGSGGSGGPAYGGTDSTSGSDGQHGSDASLSIGSGSVNADVSYGVYQSSAKTTQVYKTSMIGLPKSGNVTCSYNGGDRFVSRTASNGYLYLWLPAGSNTALAVSGSDMYTATGTTETANKSAITSVLLTLPKGEVGVSYSDTLTDSNSGYSWTWKAAAGSKLPSGLSLSTDGEITGTPKTGGEYSVVLSASYGTYTDSVTLNLKIYSSLASGLSDLSFTDVTLSPAFNPELTEYSLGEVTSSVSSITVTASASDSSSVLTINGETASSGVAKAVSLSTGANRIPVAVISADGLSQKTYVITVTRRSAPTITTDGVTVAVAGQAYSKTLSASGGSGSYTWSVSGLPSGLALSADTGVISGTAYSVGSYPLTVTVTDSANETAHSSLTLKVMKGNGNGAYLITPASDAAYTGGLTNDGLPTMTVKSGVKGFTYFTVNIEPVTGHSGMETVVFIQIRDGQQINFCFTRADIDTAGVAVAGFNVKPGDVIEVYVVDNVANTGVSPSIL